MVVVYWILVMANAAGWGTLVAGWVAVPVVGLAGSLMAPKASRPVFSVTTGAVLGWAALLALDARAPGFRAFLDVLGGLLPVRPLVVAAATLGLALVLALGAAMTGAAFRRNDP